MTGPTPRPARARHLDRPDRRGDPGGYPGPEASIAVPVLVGAAVAVVLGVYGRLHDPAGSALNVAGFSGGQSVKSWLTTVALLFGVVQLATGAALQGKLPAGPATPAVHRWSGRIAVLLLVPVLVHCLYALGFQAGSLRVLLHSLLGCFFFGAFATKMLLLSRPASPPWAVPAVGGALFTALVGLWLTSAFWFFTTFGLVR